jgi:hypothetical protein
VLFNPFQLTITLINFGLITVFYRFVAHSPPSSRFLSLLYLGLAIMSQTQYSKNGVLPESSKSNGKVEIDLKRPEPIDHAKVEAFRRLATAEDIEEIGTFTQRQTDKSRLIDTRSTV